MSAHVCKPYRQVMAETVYQDARIEVDRAVDRMVIARRAYRAAAHEAKVAANKQAQAALRLAEVCCPPKVIAVPAELVTDLG